MCVIVFICIKKSLDGIEFVRRVEDEDYKRLHKAGDAAQTDDKPGK